MLLPLPSSSPRTHSSQHDPLFPSFHPLCQAICFSLPDELMLAPHLRTPFPISIPYLSFSSPSRLIYQSNIFCTSLPFFNSSFPSIPFHSSYIFASSYLPLLSFLLNITLPLFPLSPALPLYLLYKKSIYSFSLGYTLPSPIPSQPPLSCILIPSLIIAVLWSGNIKFIYRGWSGDSIIALVIGGEAADRERTQGECRTCPTAIMDEIVFEWA